MKSPASRDRTGAEKIDLTVYFGYNFSASLCGAIFVIFWLNESYIVEERVTHHSKR